MEICPGESASGQLRRPFLGETEIDAETRAQSATARCGFPKPRGRTSACVVGGMNDCVAGGTLASGDSGKPGAPEDAALASVCPEQEG